jgi:hypothetical protein
MILPAPHALQGAMITNNSALGEAGGGAAGSGLGGGLFVQPACQGGAGCKSAFALLNGTLLDGNKASQVRGATMEAHKLILLHDCASARCNICHLLLGLWSAGRRWSVLCTRSHSPGVVHDAERGHQGQQRSSGT